MKKVFVFIISILINIAIFANIPAGYYYKADGKSGAELLDMLNVICSNGKFLGYGSGEGYTWQGFYYTDRNSDGSIIDMYSSEVRYQTDFNSVEGVHIEHSLPKSWWGSLENYAYRDLHHLYPADATTNMTKSNLPLGEVTSASFDNGVSKIGATTLYEGKEKCFEPADEYKGDFARAYFYVSTIYNELSDLWQSPMMENNTYPIWNDEALGLLLKWHRNDPVSDKEKTRQEAVYQLQHNRNPFIDYPEMVEHIWGNKKNEPIVLPKEDKAFLTSPYSWSDISFPISYVGSTTTEEIWFEGANFTKNITLKLTNNSSNIVVSKEYITPIEVTAGCDISISITSDKIGTIVDTLVIFAETDTMKLALSATFTDEFMITKAEVMNSISVDIAWTEQPNTQDYNIILRDAPDNRTTDLMFIGYVEGSSYNKAISIYNGTGSDVDLKYYSLRKQSNGTGTMKCDYPLSGVLKDGECYVMVNSRANETLKSMADKIVSAPATNDNVLNFNGNDAIALYHNNILIDAIGELNNSANWGKDVSLKRRSGVICPTGDFDVEEWLEYKKDDFSHLEEHSVELNTSSNVLNTYTTTTNSITIDGLMPNTTYFVEVNSSSATAVNMLKFTTSEATITVNYDLTHELLFYTANNRLCIEGIGINGEIIIYNIEGLEVISPHMCNENYQSPRLMRGMYVAKIITDNQLYTIKFIIK